MKTKTGVLFVIALILNSVCSALGLGTAAAGTAGRPGPISNELFDEVKVLILREIEEGRLPSASVAVAKDGEIIWLESFGMADIAKNIKAFTI